MLLALIIFIFTYILMLCFPKYKHYVATCSALIFITLGILPLNKVLGEIDFNVILMIFGTMGTVSLFIESKMPELLSDFIIKRMPNIKWMTVVLSLFAGVVSAFIDNVATVLIIAPIVLVVAKKIKNFPSNTNYLHSNIFKLRGGSYPYRRHYILIACQRNRNEFL